MPMNMTRSHGAYLLDPDAEPAFVDQYRGVFWVSKLDSTEEPWIAGKTEKTYPTRDEAKEAAGREGERWIDALSKAG